MKTYVFGCFGGDGHRIQDRELRESPEGCLLARTLDDASRGPAYGIGKTWLQRGVFPGMDLVSALHWWDESGDGRGGGHVAIFAFGWHSAHDLLVAGRQQHAQAFRVEVHMDRFGAPVTFSTGHLVFPAQSFPQGAGLVPRSQS